MLLSFFAKYNAQLLELIMCSDDAKKRIFVKTVLYLFATSRAIRTSGSSPKMYIELFDVCVEYGVVEQK